MSEELAKQFAIRLPNGELYSQCSASIFGTPECKVVVFDTEEQAGQVLNNLKAVAAQLGIPGWAGWIEHRICSPFSATDPTAAFVDDVTKWAAQQGGEA